MATKAGYDRQIAFIKHAEDNGTLIYRGETDEKKMRMGISLIRVDQSKDGGKILEEEIFGPVIPIIVVDVRPVRGKLIVQSLDEAIQYINDRPHPLALYACATTKAAQNKSEP